MLQTALWTTLKNTQTIGLNNIPRLPIPTWREQVIERCQQGARVVLMFGANVDGQLTVYTVLANDSQGQLLINAASFGAERTYPALTPDIPACHLFERELYEEFGLTPVGHPWLKLVRYSANRADQAQTMSNYPFFTMDGDEVHEVAVGPVHAGVIEPGHFRFMCHGETVYHLEIQLGYQHRGVEALFIQHRGLAPHLAESIAGDTVIGHTTAYAHVMESLAGLEISPQAQMIRGIALELERIAVHLADLGALANDVAYMMGPSVFGALRTLVINTTQEICGNRFGRGLIRVGGCVHAIGPELRRTMRNTLAKLRDEVTGMGDMMFNAPSVLSRFERTGIVSPADAKRIGLVGPAGRASDQALDVRVDHPVGIYQTHPVTKFTLNSGDVYARAYLRFQEIQHSFDLINRQLDAYSDDGELLATPNAFAPECLSVSLVEGWRGEITHAALTDADGQICRYKVKDPSFHNWFGLALAVRNNGVSDFPLCNKSFNLSYCGFDL